MVKESGREKAERSLKLLPEQGKKDREKKSSRA